MAVKTVKVESKLDSKFKVESNIRGHVITVDQPVNTGGTDSGPTPLEYLFVSLAGCIGMVGRIIAMQKQLDIRGMKISVESDLDVDGVLGKPTDRSVGFGEIRMVAEIDSDMSADEKTAFIQEAEARCPVSWNLLNASSIKISAI